MNKLSDDSLILRAQLDDLGRQLNEAFEILKSNRILFDELKSSGRLTYEQFEQCMDAKISIDEFMGKPRKDIK